jgi:hypothetical protein
MLDEYRKDTLRGVKDCRKQIRLQSAQINMLNNSISSFCYGSTGAQHFAVDF